MSINSNDIYYLKSTPWSCVSEIALLRTNLSLESWRTYISDTNAGFPPGNRVKPTSENRDIEFERLPNNKPKHGLLHWILPHWESSHCVVQDLQIWEFDELPETVEYSKLTRVKYLHSLVVLGEEPLFDSTNKWYIAAHF